MIYIYFDVTLSMGSRSSCMYCQWTTDVITYIYNNKGFQDVNYLDDLGGAEEPHRSRIAFETLGQVISDMGIRESLKKAVPPAPDATFLGILFDTERMMMRITPDRLIEIKSLLNDWLNKSFATLKELQQLLGKLNFVCSTVRAGRIFVSCV